MKIRRFLVKHISRLRCKLSRRAYRAFCEDTWHSVWPNDEDGPMGLYLLVRENGYCPNLTPIKMKNLSIIVWAN